MIVPGFNNRYPKDGDDELWSYADCRNDRIIIESCCTTLEDALSAQRRGADRIEFCTDLSVGGVTPPRELIKEVVEALKIPVNVLIRDARQLDFVYDEAAMQRMMADIEYGKSVGAAGIVVGALTPDGAIDVAAMRRLMAAASPLPVTFHRAFDVCTQDPFDALETVIGLGCTRLLTSGMAPTAWDGRALLKQLVVRAGDRLILLIGRGVTPANIKSLAAETGAREFHGTALP